MLTWAQAQSCGDTDDHRFGNNSIMELMGEGVKYQTKESWFLTINLDWLINIGHMHANAIFGRLRPKYKEDEEDAEENADENTEENAEENTEDTAEENAEDTAEENTEENTEDNAARRE